MNTQSAGSTCTSGTHADCPFSITEIATMLPDNSQKGTRKRKHEEISQLLQKSPFQPKGKFRTHQTLDVAYAIGPRFEWDNLTRYRSFILNGARYYCGDFIQVANDTTIKQQKGDRKTPQLQDGVRPQEYWVAKILDIRASDENNVFARVYWMYWPEELPESKEVSGIQTSGRQPYHGQNELIASNHMDVINVLSVLAHAKVSHWLESESDDDQGQEGLYWRQALDFRTFQLSFIDLICNCQTPANPDKMLIGCNNSACGEWLHYECLLNDALARVYEHPETELSQLLYPAVETNTRMASFGPSQSINPAKTLSEIEQFPSSKAKAVHNLLSSTMAMGDITSTGANPLWPRASLKARAKERAARKPYDGYFEAELKLDDGPTMWHLKDLRRNTSGDSGIRTEVAQCLVCGTKID